MMEWFDANTSWLGMICGGVIVFLVAVIAEQRHIIRELKRERRRGF